MDMSKHVPRKINNTVLAAMGGRYEGTILNVVERQVRNPYTGQKGTEPEIVFTDGHCLIPNLTMRRDLIARWGTDTDRWIGQVVVIVLVPHRSLDESTGITREVFHKHVEFPVEPDRGQGCSSGWEQDFGVGEVDSVSANLDEEDFDPVPGFLRKRS